MQVVMEHEFYLGSYGVVLLPALVVNSLLIDEIIFVPWKGVLR